MDLSTAEIYARADERDSGPRRALLDRRQRLVAVLVMSAVDLPAPAEQVAKLWIEAARLLPGVKSGDIPLGRRVESLTRARDLLDELIKESQP